MTKNPDGPRVVLFSGGTACRNINIALARMGVRITRIVPAWDSGGSSRELREAFDMPPVGDIRQALMTMAHGEGRAGEVVKICNARLSDTPGRQDAEVEFAYYLGGAHPRLRRMAPGLREAILSFLRLFHERLPADFDFRNGSIGNFVLTGAYFAHGRDINAAIGAFRALENIEGHVWPVSAAADVQLSAVLRDGSRLQRQHLITKMNEAQSAAGIESLSLTSAGGQPVLNEKAVGAIEEADAIVFGPGSFYTSILPHLLVRGVAEAVAANRRAPRLFVGNILECAETSGMDLAGMTRRFCAGAGPLLTHVLGNAELFPFQKTVGRFPYLRTGAIEAACRELRLGYLARDVEDAWIRGHHDGRAVASLIVALAEGRGG